SLCHADPAADWVTAMMLLGADLIVSDSNRRRRVPIGECILGAFTTSLGPAEVLEAIEIPKFSSEARWGYYRICRKSGEFPDAIGAVLIDSTRGISRIVAGALSGAPVLLSTLAQRVSAEGMAAATIENAELAVANAAPGLNAFDRRLHAAAVRRAIVQATS